MDIIVLNETLGQDGRAMKPINYTTMIPRAYREYRFPTVLNSGLNTIVRKVDKSKWEKMKKHLRFWALMLCIIDRKDK